MVKKICILILSLALYVSMGSINVMALSQTETNNYINSNGIEITFEEKERLLSLGFTNSQIEMMDRDEFDNNKNLNGQVVAQTTKYYKTTIVYNNSENQTYSMTENNPVSYTEEVTKEEYDNIPEIDYNYESTNPLGNHPGYTETNGKQMTTSIIAVNGRYRLKVDLVWKNVPSTRSYDVLAIGIDSTVSGVPDTKYVKQNWRLDNPCQGMTESHSSTSASWKTDRAGYGATFKLPSNTTCSIPSGDPLILPTYKNVTVTALSSYLYFEINKLTTPINTINAYGDYAHAIKTVSVETSIGFEFGLDSVGVGITFTPSVSTKYDTMATAQAYWDGLNW